MRRSTIRTTTGATLISGLCVFGAPAAWSLDEVVIPGEVIIIEGRSPDFCTENPLACMGEPPNSPGGGLGGGGPEPPGPPGGGPDPTIPFPQGDEDDGRPTREDLEEDGYECEVVSVNQVRCTKEGEPPYICDGAGNCIKDPH